MISNESTTRVTSTSTTTPHCATTTRPAPQQCCVRSTPARRPSAKRPGQEAASSCGPSASSLLAVIAGIAVAFTSGRRDSDSVATGDPVRGVAENISRAEQLMSQDNLGEAISAYTKALDAQPANVRALTYRGWLYFQTNDRTRAWADLDAAVKSDSTYPDAHVFRSIMFAQDQKWTDANNEYKAIDLAKAPRDVGQLLAGFRLHERILSALVGPVLLVPNPPPIASSGFHCGRGAIGRRSDGRGCTRRGFAEAVADVVDGQSQRRESVGHARLDQRPPRSAIDRFG